MIWKDFAPGIGERALEGSGREASLKREDGFAGWKRNVTKR